MVLDAKDRQSLVLHAFDRAVFGVDHGYFKGFGELLDGLVVVVKGVHGCSVELAHVSAFCCLCIAAFVIVVAFADVLLQCPAEGDVNELAAAADAEDRFFLLDEFLDEGDLEPVKGLHEFVLFAFDFGVIKGRVNVLAAGDDQAVVLRRVDAFGRARLHNLDDVWVVRRIVAFDELTDILVFGFRNQDLQNFFLHGALAFGGGGFHGAVGIVDIFGFAVLPDDLVCPDDISVLQTGFCFLL